MRVVFAGTPEFSVPCLAALYAHPEVEVVGVYTQPDRPAGRGKKIHQSPIKQLALKHTSPVFQPLSFKNKENADELAELNCDLMVVTAYGIILPKNILSIPKLGCVNVHASLLPRWRGAAPIQRAIESGDGKTGITLMQMEAGLDTGPMLAKKELAIAPDDTGGTLHDKLSMLGGQILSDNLIHLASGSLTPVPQNDDEANYASKLSKKESPLDWQDSAIHLERKVRALNPWPMATLVFGDTTMKLHHASSLPDQHDEQARPGEVLRANRDGILVQTGNGQLNLQVLQKPGGKPMAVEALLNGMSIDTGTSFELVENT